MLLLFLDCILSSLEEQSSHGICLMSKEGMIVLMLTVAKHVLPRTRNNWISSVGNGQACGGHIPQVKECLGDSVLVNSCPWKGRFYTVPFTDFSRWLRIWYICINSFDF